MILQLVATLGGVIALAVARPAAVSGALPWMRGFNATASPLAVRPKFSSQVTAGMGNTRQQQIEAGAKNTTGYYRGGTGGGTSSGAPGGSGSTIANYNGRT